MTRDERRETRDERRVTGDERRVTGDGRRETGDGRREKGDGRRETGDGRRETRDERASQKAVRYKINGQTLRKCSVLIHLRQRLSKASFNQGTASVKEQRPSREM